MAKRANDASRVHQWVVPLTTRAHLSGIIRNDKMVSVKQIFRFTRLLNIIFLYWD